MNTTANYARPVNGLRSGSSGTDFDTRLMMASIGMDVLLSQHGLEEAHTAVTEAVTQANGHGAEALATDTRLAAQRPQLFQSHPILKRAGDLIRERGWTQGDFQSASGALCAMGAIRRATGGDSAVEGEAVAVLLGRIRHELGSWAEGLSVAGWNDRRDRTVDQVLALLW